MSNTPPRRSRARARQYEARHRRPGLAVSRLTIMSVLAVVLCVVLFFGYLLLEPKLLQVEQRTVITSALSSDVKQLRIVYVSDIHYGAWPYLTESDLTDLFSTINAQNPDLVLLGGDYAQDSESAIAFFEHLPRIRSSYGVWGVLGNHDRTLPESNLARLRTAMIQANVTPIVNEVMSVRVGKQDIYLAGLDDVTGGWPDLNGVASQCRQSDLVIFLCHNPNIIPDALNAADAQGNKGWFDLGFFGHTHGGQIKLLGRLLGVGHLDGLYTDGWYSPTRSTTLLVSRGAGTSVLPFRLGCRPQIHVITIKSQE